MPNESINDFSPTGRYVTMYVRYGEILLDYIEALNEVNPSDPEIRKYWDLLRKRAGLPSIYTTISGLEGNKELQRKYIIRERQVELAIEGDRYFTLCRRKLASSVLKDATIWGLNVRGGDPATNSFAYTDFYKRTGLNDGNPADRRIWKDCYSLFPIMQPELDKSPGLVQNPKW